MGLKEESLNEGGFLRAVTVRFSAQHWLGRGLAIHFSGLHKALDAWQRLRAARGEQLFLGGHNTAAVYTPERAEQQWLRLREVFVRLQTEAGRRRGQRLQPSDVEARVRHLEASYRCTFARK